MTTVLVVQPRRVTLSRSGAVGPPGPRGLKGDKGDAGNGPVSHSTLEHLADSDDHPQYHNDARATTWGDARYYTHSYVDSALLGKANSSHTHNQSDIPGLVSDLSSKANAAATTAALANKADLVGGFIQTSQIPAIAITKFLGRVSSQAAMLALTAQENDWCIRTDAQMAYVLSSNDPTVLDDWVPLPHPTSPVMSVNGQIGIINLGASDVGAQPVDATLSAFAGLSIGANKLPYGTGTDTFATCDLSPFIRTLLDDTDQTTALNTLGAQPLNSILSSLATAPTANSAGNWYWWSGTAWIQGVSASYGRSLLNLISAANGRTLLGLIIGTDVLAPSGSGAALTAIPETMTLQFAAPTVSTWCLDAKAEYTQTIKGLYGLKTTSGTATVTVKINGTAVTGLTNLSVTSTSQDAAATGGNVAIGDLVTFEITAVSSAVNLWANFRTART